MQKIRIKTAGLYETINKQRLDKDAWPGTINLPEFIEIEIEGELLEGGTVEKCCRKCLNSQKRCSNPDCIGCHNKKEKGYKWLDIKIEAKGKDFNRETPNEKCGHGTNEGMCAACCQISLNTAKEEVKLPEKLVYKSDTNIQIKTLADTVNQLRDYLASKENK